MSYTENDPLIIVEYSGVVWSGITNYVEDFNIRDAGIKRLSQLTLNLHNENGRFTSAGGSDTLGLNDELRIRVDVGVWSGVIFQGNISEFDPDDYIEGVSPSRSILTVIAKSKYGQRCLRETSSQPYYDATYLVSGAFEHFLSSGCDSEIPTGIIVNIGGETYLLSGLYPRNLRRNSLLEAIQSPCEEYGYDGYFDDVSGILFLRRYRTSPDISGANPAIHYVLSSGLRRCLPRNSIEEVENHDLVWGGSDVGYPPDSAPPASGVLWTENGVSRFPPSGAAWSGYTNNAANVTVIVTDYELDSQLGNNCVGCFHTTPGFGSTHLGGYLSLSGVHYRRPQDAQPLLDLSDNRFNAIRYWFRSPDRAPANSFMTMLIDNVGNRAWRSHGAIPAPATQWVAENFSVLSGNHGLWTIDPGFDWSNVAALRIYGINLAMPWQNTERILIDELRFEGAGWSIDPLLYPRHNPPHIDGPSISGYGRTVGHLVDDEIRCFEQAWTEGERYLMEHKDSFARLEITEGARVWAQPSETVQVTILPWDISGATYRILERRIRYRSSDKLLRTTHDLIAQDAEVASEIIRKEKFWGGVETE